MGRFERAYLSHAEAATDELAAALGQRLWAGAVVALDGEMGAGKTAFVRGLARGLEVTEPVSSPTYTLMHEYPGRLQLYHFDAWMEGREEAFLADGGAEWIGGEGVAVIEWAERIAEWLPAPRLAVQLEHVGAEQRRLRLSVFPGASDAAERYAALLRGLGAIEGLEPLGADGAAPETSRGGA